MIEAIESSAPADVSHTVAWLLANGFDLVSSDTERGSFGSQWIFGRSASGTHVYITVDRSQWWLDVAPTSNSTPMQFDLLVAAQRGLDYRECFPSAAAPDERPLEQLPLGVIWRDSLPVVLNWLDSVADVAGPAQRAQDQRYVQMWPDSSKSKQLLREWRAAESTDEITEV